MSQPFIDGCDNCSSTASYIVDPSLSSFNTTNPLRIPTVKSDSSKDEYLISPLIESYFIPLYIRFDFVILLLNIFVCLVPILKYFTILIGSKLSFIKCLSKWQPMHVTSCSLSESTQNVSNSVATYSTTTNNKKPRTVTLRSETDELESLNRDNNTKLTNNKSRHGQHTLSDRVFEIVTQSMYIILLLVYIGFIFELSILCLSNNSLTKSTVQELISAVLLLIVHFYHYGIVNGHNLWLVSVASPESLTPSFRSSSVRNNANRRRHRQFIIFLHCFTLVYFILLSFCSISKLVLIGLIWGQRVNVFVRILRPYLLLLSVLIQCYFVIFHFVTIVSLSRLGHDGLDHVYKLSQVRYRRNRSTWLSMITFIWFLDILKLGNRKNIDLNDLGTLPQDEWASTQHNRFFQSFNELSLEQHPKSFLWRVIWRTYRVTLLLAALIKITSDLSSLIGPISIGYILTYISNYQQSTNQIERYLVGNQSKVQFLQASEFFSNGFVLAVIVLISTFVQSTLSNNFNHVVISEGIHLKTALNTCIYHKTLRMPVTNRGGSNIDLGSIANYMGIDSLNIYEFFTMMHYLWSVPIKISILLTLLYQQMGISALIGASVFFILSPFQYYCSRQISNIQKEQMNVSDERLSKTSELFLGIKLLKLLGWYRSFAEKIKVFRNKELGYLRKDAIFVAINTFITQGSAVLVTMITFTLYPLIENRSLQPSTVFTSIALFNQITTPLYIVPLVIPMLVSAIVSQRRLIEFLSMPELSFDTIRWDQGPIRLRDIAPNSAPIVAPSYHGPLERSKSSAVAKCDFKCRSASILNDLSCFIQNGFFSHQKQEYKSEEAILSKVTIHIPRNKLTIVVGSMGCGKSTLLASLLGETYLWKGEIHWQEENARGHGYVPSDPWILNVSFQENITFGRTFDRKRYNDVIKACCLQADIDILPHGDQTLIGERGINVSGGQRQRIALARAIYSMTPTLILDDALSALDPIVGSSVFENAILRLAIKQQKRTVILATHKQEFLSKADYVVVLESGTIKHQGTLTQIEKEDKAFFYQWNVIKQKEIQERMVEKSKKCKTSEERNNIVRLITKKTSFRGIAIAATMATFSKSVGAKRNGLSRQMSCDTSNAMPCHNWGDNDDVFVEEHEQQEMSNSGGFRRMQSIESECSNKRQSYLSLVDDDTSMIEMNMNSYSSSNQSISGRPTMERLYSRISNHSNALKVSIREEDEDETEIDEPFVKSDAVSKGSRGSDTSSLEDNTRDMDHELLNEMMNFNENQIDTDTLLNFDVKPEKNQIPLDVYKAYLKAHSYKLAFLVFALIILNQAFRVISDFWLAKWTDNDSKLKVHNSTMDAKDASSEVDTYILVYVILSLISVLVSLITNLSAQLVALKAVRALHDNLLMSLVNCPLKLFDNIPIGRIISRFSTDINVIDKKLPIAIPVLLRFFFLCLSAIIVNIVITPFFILAIVPVLVLYYYIQKMFRVTSRQLQRLELSSKAPILSHFTQTIDGLSTIRSFNEQNLFIDKFYQLLDINNLCFLMVNSLNCCLGIWLDYLGGIILFLATLMSIFAALFWNVHYAFVGLALTYTLLVPVYLNWLVRNMASVEMNMQSIERIYRFTKLPPEDCCRNVLRDTDKDFMDDWPKTGHIVFKNVFIQYEYNHQPILKNINLTIQSGEKIGVCGRTGSGKSSLIGALFRINKISGGTITIDGQDITKRCPNKLRKKLAIIPQELVLFSGSVRTNLDPDNEYTDEEMWKVLKDFRLNKSIKSLDEEISDDSQSNMSSGSKQLLCCARAFLRKSPILIMDESTSLLDPKSERLVLDQIFQSRQTVIAIAHRIMNIANFDKVIVVDDGRIVEFDTPSNLLSNSNSIFYSLYHKNQTK